MPEPDDVELMLAFKQGDYNAFAILVERHQAGLIQFFYAQSHDRALSEDCAQEVWRKIFRAREDYSHKARFRTYLLRIARNHWIDVFRSRGKSGQPLSIDSSGSAGDEDGGSSLSVADPGAKAPLDLLASREVAARVDDALAELPDGMRDVFVLGELQGLKYHEIAELLDIPVGTVKSRMFNAIRRLRERLQKDVNG